MCCCSRPPPHRPPAHHHHQQQHGAGSGNPPRLESAADEPDWLEAAANDLHTFDAESASLSTSLRALGSNLYTLARSQQLDMQTVTAAPRAVYSTARVLVPRLAGHVSPTRLLHSMVIELNETLTSSMASTQGPHSPHRPVCALNATEC